MAAGMKEPTAARICTKNQAELLRSFWIVVGFLPVQGDWSDSFVVGKPDKTQVDMILAKHRQ
jgi:hypothetical protein